METIFLKSFMVWTLADPDSLLFPGVAMLPLAPRTADLLLAPVLDLMRAPVTFFLAPPFLIVLEDFLTPPETLTFPLETDLLRLLKAADPLSCLKMESMETVAHFPSLNPHWWVELTTP